MAVAVLLAVTCLPACLAAAIRGAADAGWLSRVGGLVVKLWAEGHAYAIW